MLSRFTLKLRMHSPVFSRVLRQVARSISCIKLGTQSDSRRLERAQTPRPAELHFDAVQVGRVLRICRSRETRGSHPLAVQDVEHKGPVGKHDAPITVARSSVPCQAKGLGLLAFSKDVLDMPLLVGFTFAAYTLPFWRHCRCRIKAAHRGMEYAAARKMCPRFSLRRRRQRRRPAVIKTRLMGEETMEWRHEHAKLIAAEHGSPGLSPLGVVVYDEGLFADALIARCAAALVASGYRLGGIVQSNPHRDGRRRCDMYVKDLLGGDEIKISLHRGNEARGCRLDPDAFARIDAWIERAVLERVDLLIINKFGKEEAHGRGLRSVIADALIAEIPLVIGVSARNLCDFLTFAGDSATCLRPESEAITAWCRNAIEREAHHRFQLQPSSVQV
jgi:nucleoside-triphosphatase THEP1